MHGAQPPAPAPPPPPPCSFFGERQQADYARLAAAAGVSLREKPLVVSHRGGASAAATGAAAGVEGYKGEGGRYAQPTAPLAGEEGSGSESEAEEEVEVDEATAAGGLEVRAVGAPLGAQPGRLRYGLPRVERWQPLASRP